MSLSSATHSHQSTLLPSGQVNHTCLRSQRCCRCVQDHQKRYNNNVHRLPNPKNRRNRHCKLKSDRNQLRVPQNPIFIEKILPPPKILQPFDFIKKFLPLFRRNDNDLSFFEALFFEFSRYFSGIAVFYNDLGATDLKCGN